MGSITLLGKKVKGIVIDGKKVKSLNIGGKVVYLTKLSSNSFEGTFSTDALRSKFLEIKTSVPTGYLGGYINFGYQRSITSITLPDVTDIGDYGFYTSPLVYIKVPKATTIGFGAFHTTTNVGTTEVWMNIKFNTDSEKNRIFGDGNWENINFHWTNNDGSDVSPSSNTFKGTFTSNSKRDRYLYLTDELPGDTWGNLQNFGAESGITGINLPNVVTVGRDAMVTSPLTEITLPKAQTINLHAFNAVVNAASTVVTLNHKFNTDDYKDSIFGGGHWNLITFKWLNDDGTPWVDPNGNTFTGTFFSQTKQDTYMSYTTSVPDRGMYYESSLTGIGLPRVTSIGDYAFYRSQLTNINIPKATTIGTQAFKSAVNAASTIVTINKKFISDSEKNRIFGAGNWSNITFKWLNDDGTAFVPNAHNSFVGSFSSGSKQAEFMAVTDTVSVQQFNSQNTPERNLTGITLPDVVTIGDHAFSYSPLTIINIPKATTIGELVFYSVVNNSSTVVTINKKFNTYVEKNRIFGDGKWSNITFKWLNDDGSAYTPSENKYVGTWSSETKKQEFLAITNTVAANAFKDESGITSITVPHAHEIGFSSFWRMPLTHIDVRNATHMGDDSWDGYGPFRSIKNSYTTHVYLPDGTDRNGVSFRSDKYLNYIFGRPNDGGAVASEGWNMVTLHFVSASGAIVHTHSKDWFETKAVGVYSRVGDSDGVPNLKISGIDEPTLFNGDLRLTPVHSGYGSNVIYLERELNDFLKNPNSVSGGSVTEDYRVDGGSYGDDLKSRLHIYFDETEKGRIVTRVCLKTESSSVFDPWVNNQMKFSFTLNYILSSTPNRFSGDFSSVAKKIKFYKLTTTVETDFLGGGLFSGETGLTSLTLPDVTSVGSSAFSDLSLDELKLPKATDIGINAFYSLANSPDTVLTLNKKWADPVYSGVLSLAFAISYDRITIKYIDDNGNPWYPWVDSVRFSSGISNSVTGFGTFQKVGYVINAGGNGNQYDQNFDGSPFRLRYLRKTGGIGNSYSLFPDSALNNGKRVRMVFVTGTVSAYIGSASASGSDRGLIKTTLEFWKESNGTIKTKVIDRSQYVKLDGSGTTPYHSATNILGSVGNTLTIGSSWTQIASINYNTRDGYWSNFYINNSGGNLNVAAHCDWSGARVEIGILAVTEYKTQKS